MSGKIADAVPVSSLQTHVHSDDAQHCTSRDNFSFCTLYLAPTVPESICLIRLLFFFKPYIFILVIFV